MHACLLRDGIISEACPPPYPWQGVLDPNNTLAITISRLGTPTQLFCAGTLAQLGELDEEHFGSPLHSLVIVGKRVHPLEVEYAGQWAVGEGVGREKTWWKVAQDVYGVELEGEG